jgi:hypothetical protein
MAIVEKLPSFFAQVQRKANRQVIISTYSADMLHDRSIGAEEVIRLQPGLEGTRASLEADDPIVRAQLAVGLTIADVTIPRTKPANIGQLELGF